MLESWLDLLRSNRTDTIVITAATAYAIAASCNSPASVMLALVVLEEPGGGFVFGGLLSFITVIRDCTATEFASYHSFGKLVWYCHWTFSTKV